MLGIGIFNLLGRKAQSFKALKYVVRFPHSVRGLGSLGRKPFLVLCGNASRLLVPLNMKYMSRGDSLSERCQMGD